MINEKILKFTKALDKAKQERDNYKEAWDNYEVKFNKTKKQLDAERIEHEQRIQELQDQVQMAQNLGGIDANNSVLLPHNQNDQSLNVLETSQNFGGGQNDMTDNSNLYMNSYHEESPEKDTDDKFRDIQILTND